MKIIAKFLSSLIISATLTWYVFTDFSPISDKWVNNDIYNSFKIKISKNNNLILEDWVWYTYIYSQYKKIWEWAILSKDILKNVWLDPDTTILLLDENNQISFVTDYKKTKLISDYIISWITNKQEFLTQLADDKRFVDTDSDELFLKLKNETNDLTKWLSDANKISKIYDYILKNISYSKTTDNKEIFSWINTYENKQWVCWWYSKLNLYMLSFAWISNVEVKTWYVLDSKVFPNIGHAWIKISDKYYDPTYDDPIWNIKTKTFGQYKYFWLPQDLFYANKYDYGTIPSFLKTETLDSREKLITDNLYKLVTKYKNENYILLKPFTFQDK